MTFPDPKIWKCHFFVVPLHSQWYPAVKSSAHPIKTGLAMEVYWVIIA